jgi:hypothetical protein
MKKIDYQILFSLLVLFMLVFIAFKQYEVLKMYESAIKTETLPIQSAAANFDIAKNWRRCAQDGGNCLYLSIDPDGTYYLKGGNREADQGGKWIKTRIAKVINGKWITADILEFKVKMGQNNDPWNWYLKIREDGTLAFILPSFDDEREMLSAIPLAGEELAWERE